MPPIPVGILGIGVFLPPAVRRNSDWPASFVDRFNDRAADDITIQRKTSEPPTGPLAIISRYESDPFRGSRERHVLSPTSSVLEMEVEAGAKALEMANVRAEDIDLLIVSTGVPDLLGASNHSAIQERLGLPRQALTISLDNACSSLIPALLTAAGQITIGAARKALLVQSAAFSRVLDYDRPHSVNFGDGATAVVVGPVGEGYGIQGWSWFNDGTLNRTVCFGPAEGGAWYQGAGRLVVASQDVEGARRMVHSFGGWAKEAIEGALTHAKLEKRDVDFFACHQPVVWFNPLCAQAAGLEDVPTECVFPQTAGLGPANVPINLDAGVRSGKLRPGGLAMLYAMGSGTQWGAMALRWGK